MRYVPVVDSNQLPLMPTTPSRADRWIKTRKATGFWKQGIYCVRLNTEPSGRITQPIAAGVDPGSKREAITLKSRARTFLNVHLHARTGVKEKLETRRNMRRTRRTRTTPYRKCRPNRGHSKIKGRIPPSTFARWNNKLRVLDYLLKIFPVTHANIEDIQAETRKKRKKKKGNRPSWNAHFSPLQVGKEWFYVEIQQRGLELETRLGWHTKELRDQFGLKKTKQKMAETFSAHCVDSWVLANDIVGGHTEPDNIEIFVMKPLDFARRQLHKLQPAKGGERANYGGTAKNGLVRGSLVIYKGRGLGILGGWTKVGLTINTLAGEPKYKAVKRQNIQFVAYNKWVTHYVN